MATIANTARHTAVCVVPFSVHAYKRFCWDCRAFVCMHTMTRLMTINRAMANVTVKTRTACAMVVNRTASFAAQELVAGTSSHCEMILLQAHIHSKQEA